MHANARVLHYSDTENASDLAGKLEDYGSQPLPANCREGSLRIVTERYPNIAVADAAEIAVSARFRKDLRDLFPTSDMPTIIIGAADETPDDSLQIEILPGPFRNAKLFSRLAILSRLVTMQDELALRSETSQLYGLETPAPVPHGGEAANSRVLVATNDDGKRWSIVDMIATIAKT